jgi:hypothetical protein
MTQTVALSSGPEACNVGEWFPTAAHPTFGIGYREYEWTPPSGGPTRVFHRLRLPSGRGMSWFWFRVF